MEIIIFVAVVVVAALLWNGYVKTKKTESDQAIDNWKPISADQPWPYGEKLPEGKIHVKTTDVAGSEYRVEAPAPTVADATAENKAAAVAKIKKAPAKKTAAKPVAAKRTPAKKKSV